MKCLNKATMAFLGAPYPTHCREHVQSGQIIWKRTPPKKKPTTAEAGSSASMVSRTLKRKLDTQLQVTPSEPKVSPQQEVIQKKPAGKQTPPQGGKATSLRAKFDMTAESSPSEPKKKSGDPKCMMKDCKQKATHAYLKDDRGEPVLCDYHGKDCGTDVYEVISKPPL